MGLATLRRSYAKGLTAKTVRATDIAFPVDPFKTGNEIVVGKTVGLEFKDNKTIAYRTFKAPIKGLPNSFTFHLHWGTNGSEDGFNKTFEWKVVTAEFDGKTEPPDNNISEYIISVTSSHSDCIVYRTEDIPIIVEPSNYLSFEISTLPGTLNSPVLFSIDLQWEENINV